MWRQRSIRFRVGAETISDPAYSSLNAVSTRARGLIPDGVAAHPIATMLWRRRHIVGWTVLGAFVLACLYILLAQRSYTSTAQVYVVEGQGSAATDPAHIDNFLNTQCQLMTSTPVLALALAQDGINDLETLRGVGDPIDYLRQNINAEVGKHSELIDVSLEVPNKLDAAKLVNAVVQAYITFQTGIQHNTSAQELDLLLKETAQDVDAIAAKNQQLAALHDQQEQPADDSTQNNPAVQQESALSNSLPAARLNAENAKSDFDQALAFVGNDPAMLAKIEAPGNSADMVAASPDQLLQMRAEIVQYQQAIQDMERTYLPDHPHVKMARSQLNELTVAYVRALRERWLSAQSHEQALQTPVEHQHKAAPPVQVARSSDVDRMHTELTQAEKDLQVVEARINQVSANEVASSLSIEITQSAVPASSPSHPAKLRVGWMAVCGFGHWLRRGVGPGKIVARSTTGKSIVRGTWRADCGGFTLHGRDADVGRACLANPY